MLLQVWCDECAIDGWHPWRRGWEGRAALLGAGLPCVTKKGGEPVQSRAPLTSACLLLPPPAAGVFTGGQRGLVTPNMTAKGVRAWWLAAHGADMACRCWMLRAHRGMPCMLRPSSSSLLQPATFQSASTSSPCSPSSRMLPRCLPAAAVRLPGHQLLHPPLALQDGGQVGVWRGGRRL